jgi:predicted nucleotidyltransferase
VTVEVWDSRPVYLGWRYMVDRSEIVDALRATSGELRERFGVLSLKLFGSAARGDAAPGSDIDVLVDFGGPPTFDQYMDLKFFLEELLCGKVDLVTESGLRPRLRPHIEQEAIRVA